MSFYSRPLEDLERSLKTIGSALPTLPERQLREEMESLRWVCKSRPIASLLLDLYEAEIENRRQPGELAL